MKVIDKSYITRISNIKNVCSTCKSINFLDNLNGCAPYMNFYLTPPMFCVIA